MSDYRYQLERYRGRGTRHISPQCHRKQSFTRYYIDTHNNNEYINNNIGKYYLLDKYGYHYTPKQHFADTPWKRDDAATNSGSLRPCGYHYTPKQYFTDNHWKRDRDFFLFQNIGNLKKRKSKSLNPRPSLRSDSSKEKRQPPLCGWIFSSPEGAPPNLTGIKKDTRTTAGRSDNK